ncbi:MAG: DUF6259 domain-containing protein, partial [Candidatus Omnitrophota bacterium]
TSPGDVVIGPFSGDWYDATQLYRKWAITAPWAAKGPIHARSDVPNWLKNATYWTVGNMGGVTGINHEMEKHEFLGSGGIFHAYGYYHNLGDKIYPEVFPPKIGSEGFKNTVDEFHKKGIRVVTYINGSCWDETTESYQKLSEDQKKRGRTDTYGGGVWLAGMSPCEKLWQDKLAEVCSHGVAKYGIDGWYIDFLTNHTGDCFKTDHGHPIAGGNHWTKSVRDIYGRLRREIKALNPDGMLTAEANVEWVIDLLDTQLVLSEVQAKAPLYQAVYHDYGMIFGGSVNNSSPCVQGRWWLMGNQNGWHNVEGAYAVPPTDFYRTEAKYYLRLLRCHREFGLPYLGYGRMLRMPRITTAMPVVTHDGPGRNSGQPVYTVPAVEGSAWQAADGTVGIFFLNYSGEPQEFTWTMDLGEAAGWGAGDKLRLSQWMEEGGLQAAQEINGGKLNRSVKMEGRGILALKLEVIR